MSKPQDSVRVLIVDDNRIIADSLAFVIRGRGFDSRAVYSGEAAVHLALSWRPDAAILDSLIGPMNGGTLANYLSKVLPSCNVLLMSGDPDSERQYSHTVPGQKLPFLAKPFDVQCIVEFLESTSAAKSA